MTKYRQRLTDLLMRASPERRQKFFARLSADELDFLLYDWQIWARSKQLPPAGAWTIWLMIAGRGFGKTRAGAEWIRGVASRAECGLIALVGHTFDDVRHVMVEGNSGIVSISPPAERPEWFPSKRLLVWANGVKARCYSAEDPDQLRGPEHEKAWCDEIAKWRYRQTWDNLLMGLRVGKHPQVLATTTPRPLRWLNELATSPHVHLTQGHSYENVANLADGFINLMKQRYAHSPLMAQEIEGKLLTELPNALWTRKLLAASYGTPPSRQDLSLVVVGVDPAVGGDDETGIIVAGKSSGGVVWILDDVSLKAPPRRWVERIISVAKKWRAHAVVVEVNQGGDVIIDMMRSQKITLPIRKVRARHGKARRAEPVAALYGAGQIRHARVFAELEDQMCSCVPGQKQTPSPDRLDAMVWAVKGLDIRSQARATMLPI